MRPLYLIFSLFLLILPNAFAQSTEVSGTYQISPSNTKLEFSAKHLGVINVDGTFKDFSGSISIIKGLIKFASIAAKVESISTDNNSRDRTLKDEDFLDAKGHPQITFDVNNNQHYTKVLAEIIIKGEKQSYTIPYSIITESERLVKIEIEFAISRKDYDLDFGVMDDLVSDEIRIKAIVLLSY